MDKIIDALTRQRDAANEKGLQLAAELKVAEHRRDTALIANEALCDKVAELKGRLHLQNFLGMGPETPTVRTSWSGDVLYQLERAEHERKVTCELNDNAQRQITRQAERITTQLATIDALNQKANERITKHHAEIAEWRRTVQTWQDRVDGEFNAGVEAAREAAVKNGNYYTAGLISTLTRKSKVA